MTPQEQKAKELLVKFYKPIFDIDLGKNILHDGKRYKAAKQCALIAVQELIEESHGMLEGERYKYWNEVYSEIIKKL